MNYIAEEIRSYIGSSEIDGDSLEHYGTPRHSGRYPWGSGDNGYQRAKDFLGRVEQMRRDGYTYTDPKTGKIYTGDTAIAKGLNMSTTDFRTEIGICQNERRMYDVQRVNHLRDEKGMGWSEIGRELGMNESSVRSLYNKDAEARTMAAKQTADFIKKRIDEVGMVDVGTGVERELNCSKQMMDKALYLLEREGYQVYGGRVEQATNPGNFTTLKVACPPGTEHKEIYQFDKINSLKEYITRDGGETYEKKFHYPESLDSKRLKIRYNEEGGVEKDGVIELRRGVDDLSLGESRYSQVRILVDGTHYLKGMAVYSDDMPDGVDVVFNTNKKVGTPMTKVLKEIKADPDNPFGATIKDADKGGQYWYDPETGKRVSASDPNAKLGLINKKSDEGDWTEWADALPSQFLSKQSVPMAKKQLKLAYVDKRDEYNDICALENPTIKKHLLQKFADQCDSAAVDLKAAALPGQKYHVIIPVNSLKDDEIYAPGYAPGTKLALVRYPHAGTFEIPLVTVTDKNMTAKKLIGTDSIDAVCINAKVAERLSGADFDGDTVMCIPTHDRAGKVKIASRDPLDDLVGFDAKLAYPEREGMRYMKNPITGKDSTQVQMGMISNLISDMTLIGAPDDEMARAVKHSMVVIDAAKHKLDYKRSEQENGIAALHKKYQGHYDENGKWHNKGAGTIISRAKGEVTVDKRQGSPIIDPETGKQSWKTADDLYYQERYDKDTRNHKKGELKYNPDGTPKMAKRTQASTRMAEADDAYSLVSERRHPMEIAYADYANSMKALANQARKEMLATGKIETSAAAKKTYESEVKSLMSKLNDAEKNAPRERLAQVKAIAEVDAKVAARKAEGDEMSRGDIKKARQQALSKYRGEVGSVSRRDRNINITDREWEAIQAGAISENKLKRILDNADVDRLRALATPRATATISQTKINRIKTLSDSNFTVGEIAEKLNIPKSTVVNYLKGEN